MDTVDSTIDGLSRNGMPSVFSVNWTALYRPHDAKYACVCVADCIGPRIFYGDRSGLPGYAGSRNVHNCLRGSPGQSSVSRRLRCGGLVSSVGCYCEPDERRPAVADVLNRFSRSLWCMDGFPGEEPRRTDFVALVLTLTAGLKPGLIVVCIVAPFSSKEPARLHRQWRCIGLL